LWNLLGLKNTAARSYNVRNLASSNATANLWTTPRTGSDLYTNGLFVGLGGGTVNPITDDGELVQFLRVVDVTPPPSPTPLANYYEIGSSGTFSWVPNAGPDDNVASWLVEIFENGVLSSTQTVPGTQTSLSFSGSPGNTYRARITAISATNVSSTTPGNSDSGPPNPSSTTSAVKLLLAEGDDDGDGRSNLDEQNAGTNPLDAASLFKVLSIQRSSPAVSIGFTSVIGKTYQLETSTSLDSGSWIPVAILSAVSFSF
jgi:hypothetical protein